jgi:hypothetical protein
MSYKHYANAPHYYVVSTLLPRSLIKCDRASLGSGDGLDQGWSTTGAGCSFVTDLGIGWQQWLKILSVLIFGST